MRIEENEKRLETLCKKRKFEYFDVIDSTNLYLKNNVSDSMPVAVSDSQTMGRGRLGRSFYSHGGIYFSVPYKFTSDEKYLSFLTLSAGLAVRQAIKNVTGLCAFIKWPNDIYLNNRKICGILVETLVSGSDVTAVVGIGINTDTSDFPDDINNKAGSLNLKSFGGDNISLIADIINILDDLVFNKNITNEDNEEIDNFVGLLNEYSYTVGRTVEYDGKKYTAVKINRSGSLTIESADGEKTDVFYGEVKQ